MQDEHGASKANGRYIAAAVDLFHHPVFKGEAFDRRSAWLWLIAQAAWKDHKTFHKGKPLILKRGQVIIGRAHLAKEWGWSEQSVRTFLANLCSLEMITISNQSDGHYANVATICNYDKYQSKPEGRQPVQQPEPNQSPPKNQPDSTQTPENISNTQSVAAREGLKDFDFGVGVVREPSPEARAAVCQTLGIANAEPLVAVYRRWKGARKARNPDAMFKRAAAKMFDRLSVEDRQRCQPSDLPAVPTINVRTDVRASSALLASLTKGGRYAN